MDIIEQMDIIDYLDNQGIKVTKSGKNVSAGWIGIRCPFCDDTSNHLGIHVKSLKCSCWKCGGHHISKLLQELLALSRKQANLVIKKLDRDDSQLISDQQYENLSKVGTKLPPHLTTFPDIYRDYLKSRGFLPKRIRKKYDLLAAGHVGRYKFRIIIPIYIKRQLVSFTSRAIFDEMTPPYLMAQMNESMVRPRFCIYNYDNIYDGYDCMIVEGPADVWRFGDGCCSTVGMQFTDAQLSLLREKEIKNLFIMLDAERYAQRVKAEQIGNLMAPWVDSVELLEAKWKKDLGDFTHREAHDLRKHLNFKGSRHDFTFS